MLQSEYIVHRGDHRAGGANRIEFNYRFLKMLDSITVLKALGVFLYGQKGGALLI